MQLQPQLRADLTLQIGTQIQQGPFAGAVSRHGLQEASRMCFSCSTGAGISVCQLWLQLFCFCEPTHGDP